MVRAPPDKLVATKQRLSSTARSALTFRVIVFDTMPCAARSKANHELTPSRSKRCQALKVNEG